METSYAGWERDVLLSSYSKSMLICSTLGLHKPFNKNASHQMFICTQILCVVFGNYLLGKVMEARLNGVSKVTKWACRSSDCLWDSWVPQISLGCSSQLVINSIGSMASFTCMRRSSSVFCTELEMSLT